VASIVPYGEKKWRVYLLNKGKRETKLCGSQKEARAWAAKREKELATSSSVKFGEVAEAWLKLKIPSFDSEVNQRTVDQSVRDYILPPLAHKRLDEITRADLVVVVESVAKRGTIETAHRVGQRIRQIFDFAVDSGQWKDPHVATSSLSRVLPKRRRRKMAAVRIAELPALLRAIDQYPEPITRIGLLLLAHTFTRTNELIRARWEEIRDPATWVIDEKRMKGKDEERKLHVVPLSRQVQALLAQARHFGTEVTGGVGSNYFLASTVNALCGISSNTLLFALYRLGYRGRMTGHGFRAIASSVLNESGLWNPDAIERQLHHDETNDVRASYNRAEYLEERRRMMQWYSDYLESRAASTAS
jgi:integrase